MLASATTTRVVPRHFLRQLSIMQNIHSHAILRASRLNMDEEFVEDSEPEREAQRQAQKQERKRKKLELAAMNELAATAARMNPANVIIISDESVPASPVAASKASFQLPQSSVIDISDTSTSISANENVISISSSTSDTNLNVTTAEENTNSLGAEPLASPSKSNNSDEEEIVSTLGPGLARFAYANPNPRPLGPRNSASTLQSTSSSDSQTKPAAKPKARTSSKGVAGEFSDSELAKLVKCVSCDLSWTTRKTGAQKILHIRSCAKKTGLTDDTVRLLIRKELDNPANDPGPSNRNGKATLVPAPRTTLLEDTVRDAGPRRKGKRKEVVNNLKSVSETHDNIRDKARMVFGPAPSSDDDSFPVQTQAVTANKPSAAQENCATQAFGTSRLGQQHRYKSLLGGQDSDDEPDALPATQAFAPSKLGGRTPATSGWGYESESESSVQEPDAPAAETPLNFPSSSAKELSPTFSPRTKKKTIVAAPTFLAMESESDHDAYVHFDPELELNGEAVESTLSGKSKKNKETTRETPTKAKQKSPKAKPRVRAPSDTDDSPGPKAKPKRSRKKAVDEFDENWELGLKEKILADQDLHFRILRYEPINFDIFIKLATEEEPTARLKLKLRIFLDKQAINFYGGEATKPRTKRRR